MLTRKKRFHVTVEDNEEVDMRGDDMRWSVPPSPN